jgi:hypothetical protein
LPLESSPTLPSPRYCDSKNVCCTRASQLLTYVARVQATKAAFPRLRKCTVLCTRDTQGAESYKAVW